MTAVLLPLVAVIAAFGWLIRRGDAARILDARAARLPHVFEPVPVQADPPRVSRIAKLIIGLVVLAALSAVLLAAASLIIPSFLERLITFEY